MGLQLDMGGSDPLPLSEVYLSRAIGQAVRWRFVVALRPESWGETEGNLVQRIGRALVEQPCKATASWRNGQIVTLGPAATVVGASRTAVAGLDEATRAVHYLEIEADGTSPEPRPDSFLPRRRVHKVRNLKELIGRLDHVAKPVGALLSNFERIEFPDGDRTTIVQDGISDWLFLFHVLDQCCWLAGPTATWLPLALVGGVDDSKGTEGRWVITPGAKTAYEEWGTVRERSIPMGEADGAADVQFASLGSAERVPAFPGGELPCVIDRREQRKFDADRWKRWRTMDLPRFTDSGAMVWRIEDRLYFGGHGLGWESQTYAVPSGARIVGPQAPGRLRPWTGLGRVDQSSRTGPWISVRLAGFETNDDIVNVRIGTPYSGTNGKRGLHMVPEKDTEVLLAWSGRFDQSIVLAGNARSEAADYASPSIYLEAEHTAQYANIHVVKVGEVKVDSGLSLGVGQRTDITSAQVLQVKADGADLKMASGTVYTGRGF